MLWEAGLMFKHILVPTDLTERSLKSLEIAAKMALHDGGEITLLHVVEVIEDTDGEEFKEFYQKLGRRAHKRMDKMIHLQPDRKVTITKEITYGKRISAIINYAVDKDVDLIVLASHRIDLADSTQGWGSISYKVGILSHCPVLLVK